MWMTSGAMGRSGSGTLILSTPSPSMLLGIHLPTRLSDPDNHERIFNLVSSKDETFVMLNCLNNFKGWSVRADRSVDKSHKTHYTCVGRWTTNKKRKGNKAGRETHNEYAAGGNQCSDRATCQTWGWKEGLEVYDKATNLFYYMRVKEIRETHPGLDQLKSESRDWFYIQVLSNGNKETQSRSNTKNRATWMDKREAFSINHECGNWTGVIYWWL